MPFKKGVSGNLAGRPHSVFQSFADRLAHWLETKTVGEIQAIVRNKKQWTDLSAIDAVVVRRIAAAMAKEKSTADFTAVLDRLVGKPVQPIAASFDVRHGLAERIEKARQKLLTTQATGIVIDHVMDQAAAEDDEPVT